MAPAPRSPYQLIWFVWPHLLQRCSAIPLLAKGSWSQKKLLFGLTLALCSPCTSEDHTFKIPTQISVKILVGGVCHAGGKMFTILVNLHQLLGSCRKLPRHACRFL